MRVTQQNSPWTTWFVVIRIYITYFKCKDTCVSSVNKIHKNQNNRDKHQCCSNASSNYFCLRACCLCKKINKSWFYELLFIVKKISFLIKCIHCVHFFGYKTFLSKQILNIHATLFQQQFDKDILWWCK